MCYVSFVLKGILALLFSIYLFFTDGRSGLGSLLSLNSSGKTDRIYMKGPGGRGEVEVAVSGVVGKLRTNFFFILPHYKFDLTFLACGELVFCIKTLFDL